MLNPILNRTPVSRLQLGWSIVALMSILLPLATLAMAQEIRGLVMESGTTQPVTDAKIRIIKMPPRVTGQALRPEPVAELTTDGQGRFRFSPEDYGEYMVTVNKNGYSDTSTPFSSGNTTRQANVFLTEENPEAVAELTLGRAGQISGRFLNADSGDPIPGLRVFAGAIHYTDGVRLAVPMFTGNPPVTGADGRFVIRGLPPGDYVIQTQLFNSEKQRFLEEFTEDDLDVVDEGYAEGYYPGGPSIQTALPFALPSGGNINVGTISIRPVKLYRVHAKISESGCPPGATIQVTPYIINELGGTGAAAATQVTCGGDVLMQHLESGKYGLWARTVPNSGGEAPPRRLATDIPMDIQNTNLDVELVLQPGFPLEGKVVPAEGSGEIALDELNVTPFPVSRVLTRADFQSPVVDADGQFLVPELRTGTYDVRLTGLPPNAYISAVRFKGAPQPEHKFDFTGDGQLEIEIDTRAAALSGTVNGRSSPVPRATVFAVRWPIPAATALRRRETQLAAHESGAFNGFLPPGDYRIFALAAEDANRINEPGLLERLAQRGEKLEAERNGVYNLTLELEDPAR